MEIEIGVEELGAEGVDLGGEALGDVGIAQALAHHRAILGLGQTVVVGMPGPGFGELHAQLVEHLGDLVVDVLGAVVGVEAPDHEGEAVEQGLDDRQQEGLADPLAGGYEFPLGDAVHRVDVIDPLHPVLIALMHAVDADETRLAIGRRRAALANGQGDGTRLAPLLAMLRVAAGTAQVVQVAHRDRRQPGIARIPMDARRPLEQVAGGRAGEGAVQGVGLSQQGHVLRRELAGKSPRRWAIALAQPTGSQMPFHQPGELLPGVAGRVRQVAQHRPLVRTLERRVAEPSQHPADVPIAGNPPPCWVEKQPPRYRQQMRPAAPAWSASFRSCRSPCPG